MQIGRVLRQILLDGADRQLTPYRLILLNDPGIPIIPELRVYPFLRKLLSGVNIIRFSAFPIITFQIFIGIVLQVNKYKSAEKLRGSVHNVPHLLLFHDQLCLLPVVFHDKDQNIYHKQQNQPKLQIHGLGIGFFQHCVGDLNWENLQKHPVFPRQLRYIRRVRALLTSVGQTLGVTTLQRVFQSFQCFLIRAFCFFQSRKDVFLGVIIVGTGKYRSIGQTQISHGRLLKKRRGNHLTHLLFTVASRQNTYDLSVKPQWGVKNHQILMGMPAVKYNIHPGMARHAILKIETVRDLRPLSVVVGIDTVSTHNANIIKGGVIHHFLQCFNIYPVRIHRLSVQMGNGTDAVLRSDKQIFDSLGCLICRVLHILRVSGYRHAAVRIQVSRETRDNTNQQNTCRNDTLPNIPLSSHKKDSHLI